VRRHVLKRSKSAASSVAPPSTMPRDVLVRVDALKVLVLLNWPFLAIRVVIELILNCCEARSSPVGPGGSVNRS